MEEFERTENSARGRGALDGCFFAGSFKAGIS